MVTKEQTPIHPNIGIQDTNREEVVELLNRLLADEHVLYIKLRNYHWHVVGPQFDQLHRFFEEQYTELAESIDVIAERVRTLGGHALATMAEFVNESRLEEHPGHYPDANQMIVNLLEDHEAIIRHLREDQERCDEEYNDMGTNDFLIALMEAHEKLAWMLRAFLGR
jgi:starvation-inducible DNA-binding protein